MMAGQHTGTGTVGRKVCKSCGRSPVVAFDLCSTCYARFRRNGSTGYQNRPAGTAKEQVYAAVVEWFKREGFAPSVQNLRDAVLSATGKSIAESTVRSAIRELVKDGRLRRTGERRSIALPEGKITIND